MNLKRLPAMSMATTCFLKRLGSMRHMTVSSTTLKHSNEFLPFGRIFWPFSSQSAQRRRWTNGQFNTDQFGTTSTRIRTSENRGIIDDILKGLVVSFGILTFTSIGSHERDRIRRTLKNSTFYFNFDDVIGELSNLGRFSSNKSFYYSQNEEDMVNAFKLILGINVVVFGCWNLNILTNILSKYFIVTPNSPFIANILCQYSHIDLMHIFFNMYCLNSFIPSLSNILKSEDFVALYTIGGMFASIASKFYKLLYKINTPSLGASGSIMTMLAIICCMQPNSRFTVPFIGPTFGLSFDGNTTLGLILIGEIAMMLFGSSNIDHVAHIAGLLTGIIFCNDKGSQLYFAYKSKLIKIWKQYFYK